MHWVFILNQNNIFSQIIQTEEPVDEADPSDKLKEAKHSWRPAAVL